MNAEIKNEVPEYKKQLVTLLTDEMNKNNTVLIASIKGLPGSQYHTIKKKLREKAEIKIAKKTAFERAIDASGKKHLKDLKAEIVADVAIIFSNVDAFELSGILTDNESPARAKAGDIAPEDIDIEPGPTELIPGPAISELSGVGLKVAVENGKLAIKKSLTIVKAGEEITDKIANVLGKLDIAPMKVGLIPIAAYDTVSDEVYVNIKVDKEGTLEVLRTDIEKAFGLAVNLNYPTKEIISFLINKAGIEEKVIELLIEKGATPTEEKAEEDTVKTEETPAEITEEKVENSSDNKSEKEDA